MSLFDACWERWDRADEHRQALAGIWNAYLQDHPFDFGLVQEAPGSYVLRVWQNTPTPARMSVVLGEWLYNLRASLDYLIWATSAYVTGQNPPPDEHSLQYPIYDREKGWEHNLYRLKHLDAHHRDMLWTMQPFNSDIDANYLGWINRLAVIDRHRRLVTGTAYLGALDPIVQVPLGTTVHLEFGDRVLRNGHADAARITLDPWDDEQEVQCNPRVGIDPEIVDWSASPFWSKQNFGERLTMMQVFVAAEIAIYEYDCTGHSRKTDLLTESYRAESDDRGPYRNPVAQQTPTQWQTPKMGKPSTHDRFLGRDFPTEGSHPRSAWPGIGDT